MFSRSILTFSTLAFLASSVVAQEPQWLRQAAAASVPTSDKESPAVVLLDESVTTVSADGRLTTHRRYAVRVLKSEGRGSAVAREVYQTSGGRVREMSAWLIRPSGAPRLYGKDAALDVAATDNDVYNEVRVRMISASDDAEVGSVFGCEVTSEDRTIFTQFEWPFQSRLPVLFSRRVLTVPQGWRVASVTFNHTRIEPAITGSTYAWELRNLPFIAEEPASPGLANLVPRVAVSLFPPTDKTSPLQNFDSWLSVARFIGSLSDPQAQPDQSMTVKARELTATARSEMERIQAIATYVQGIHYISIQTGLGRGGGYRPHAATEVFARSYGDCKDKVNLMRAMLKALGIVSYPVGIYAGDSTYVREEWPSPQQFNHCIIAVQISDETQVDFVIKHPTLGRLLLFDPTDPNTLLGDLPQDEQGSLALLAAGDAGVLMRTPTTPPSSNRLERRIEVTLAADGSMKATLNERATGQSGAIMLGEFRQLTQPDYARRIGDWIARGVPGARATRIDATDRSDTRRFTLTVEFTTTRFAQAVGQLFVFKPAMFAHHESMPLTSTVRKHPIVMRSNSYEDVVRIKLPEGFSVEELPPPVRLDSNFGTYNATFLVEGGSLVVHRVLELRSAVIPAEQYTLVRGFFDAIRTAEKAPVVLAKTDLAKVTRVAEGRLR